MLTGVKVGLLGGLIELFANVERIKGPIYILLYLVWFFVFFDILYKNRKFHSTYFSIQYHKKIFHGKSAKDSNISYWVCKLTS